MKKRTILWIFSIILLIVASISTVSAVAVAGSGFLDLSNWVRTIALGIAVVCGILSLVTAVIACKTK